MKCVTAYQATDGSLHQDKKKAAFATLLHFSEKKNGIRGNCLTGNTAEFLIEHRSELVKILKEIDAPDAGPQ